MNALAAEPILDARYVLLEAIGRGGMGRVYRAFDRETERTVALKVLHGVSRRGPSCPLSEEFAAWARLRHPNIVRAYALGFATRGPLAAGTAYLVLEHVAGAPIHRTLVPGREDPARVESVARQILEALAHVHDTGWVHRDLKPGNVLARETVRGGVCVKLTDFGLAASAGSAREPGRVSGSLPYVPPEAILGGRLDGRADLYALGILLFFLICGRLPFDASGADDVIRWHVQGPPADPRALNPDCPDRLARLVARLTARDPDARPADARSALGALGVAARCGSAPGASVRGASARGASVPGASVRGASARGASVPGASARGASVPGASVPGASVRDASALDGAARDGPARGGAARRGRAGPPPMMRRGAIAALRLAFDAARIGAWRSLDLPADRTDAEALAAEACVLAQIHGATLLHLGHAGAQDGPGIGRLVLRLLLARGPSARELVRRHGLERCLPLGFFGGLPVWDRMRAERGAFGENDASIDGTARAIATFVVESIGPGATVLVVDRGALREPLAHAFVGELRRLALRRGAPRPTGGGLLLVAPTADGTVYAAPRVRRG